MPARGTGSPATASSHLRVLANARLVAITEHGRERIVELADSTVADILERLAMLSAPTVRREMRFARTCYDHLAGGLAILSVESFVERRWLHRTTDNLEPSPALLDWLAERGHSVATGKRPLSRACLDWTERVPHVAGRVGAARASVFLAEAGSRVPKRERSGSRSAVAALADEYGIR